MKIARSLADRHGPEAHAKRGRVRLRAAAVRDRRRHGRRSRRRGGGRDRGDRATTGGGTSSARRASRRSSTRRTGASGSARSPIRARPAWGRRSPSHRRRGDERIVFGHVGDSRAYRLRGDGLEQITTDHSLVAELVESGVLTPEEAERHPQRSAITRAVGTERAIEVDVFTVPAEPGDLVLLCSDGLTDMLSEDEIAAVLLEADRDPAAAPTASSRPRTRTGRGQHHRRPLRDRREGEPDPVTEDDPALADDEIDDLRRRREPPWRRLWRSAGRAGAHRRRVASAHSSSTGASVGERAAARALRLVLAGLIASVALTTVTVARDAELSPG